LFCFAKVQNILHHTSSASLPIQESGGTFPRWGRLINSRLSYHVFIELTLNKILSKSSKEKRASRLSKGSSDIQI